MSEYSPKPKSFGGKLKIELYLCNYATKSDLKNETGVDTSKFDKRFLQQTSNQKLMNQIFINYKKYQLA